MAHLTRFYAPSWITRHCVYARDRAMKIGEKKGDPRAKVRRCEGNEIREERRDPARAHSADLYDGIRNF
jgi:hypothetical protein